LSIAQDFAGRVALITGAARGLGRAAAARLLERGASVAINVRDLARAEATVHELGGSSFAVPGDLEQDGVAESLVERTVAEFGRLDILVNNAALPLTTRFEQITAEEWRRAL
jgi:NAD(P)-dependent dehydrogenase (short-subunit alcohol dehydrogenase family)